MSIEHFPICPKALGRTPHSAYKLERQTELQMRSGTPSFLRECKGDLANKDGKRHIERGIDIRGQRVGVVGEDLDHGGRVVHGYYTRLLHAQQARLALCLPKGAGCVYGGVSVVSLGSRTDRRKGEAHLCGDTRDHLLAPGSLDCRFNAGSSQAFTVERSMISGSGGSTSTSSGIVGPLRTPGRGGGHHQRQLEHACGPGQGHYVVLQLRDGNVTHPVVQANLVIDKYNGSIFTRETLFADIGPPQRPATAVSVLLSTEIAKTRLTP